MMTLVFVSINSHTHLGVVIMENSKLLVEIIKASYKKNNIVSIEEKSNENTNDLGSTASCSF